MKKILTSFYILLLTGMISSCATIMRDNMQSVPIKSNVEQVKIKIEDKKGNIVYSGTAPTTLSLNAAHSGYFDPEKYTVTASKPGYGQQTKIIDWHVSKWYIIGNFFLGGILGYLIIDPITGDMFYLDEEINLNMSELPS